MSEAESVGELQGGTPFVTVTLGQKGEEVSTNLSPAQRPLIVWLLEKGKLQVLTQLSEQEKSMLVKPNNGLAGLMRCLGKG